MSDISIKYGNKVVEFYNVPYKCKKSIEDLLHAIENSDDSNVISGVLLGQKND